MPGICIQKATHCLKQSLITPSNESLCTLDFNLIIIVSIHKQGNYSTETSNSGFLSKHLQCSVHTYSRLQCWLMLCPMVEVRGVARWVWEPIRAYFNWSALDILNPVQVFCLMKLLTKNNCLLKHWNLLPVTLFSATEQHEQYKARSSFHMTLSLFLLFYSKSLQAAFVSISLMMGIKRVCPNTFAVTAPDKLVETTENTIQYNTTDHLVGNPFLQFHVSFPGF